MMTQTTYEVTDRRPIAARRFAVMHHLAARLADAHISANSISVIGMFCGIFAGVSLYLTTLAGPFTQRILWLLIAALIQLRLLANLLDGMVAIASGTASRLGELFNDAPDRISDAATLVGLGYCVGGQPALGWMAAVLAVLTAYVRLLGKASGAGSDFCGPMAKQHRMFMVTVTCLLCALAPAAVVYHPAVICLWIICAGCGLTIIRRMNSITMKLRGKA